MFAPLVKAAVSLQEVFLDSHNDSTVISKVFPMKVIPLFK
jgi:hypothetical protein